MLFLPLSTFSLEVASPMFHVCAPDGESKAVVASSPSTYMPPHTTHSCEGATNLSNDTGSS